MSPAITDIDRNMAVEAVGDLPVVFVAARECPAEVNGLCHPEEGGPYRRLPPHVAAATNEGVAFLYLHTSGGRVRFRTDSPYLALRATFPSVGMMSHITLTGTVGMDVYLTVDGEPRYHATCMTEGGNDAALRMTENHGYTNLIHLPDGMKEVTVNLPLYGTMDELFIGTAPEAALEAPAPYRDVLPTVYYGSSITQGGCASRPGNNYPAILSRRHNVDFLNLGFSGSARGEEVMADHIAGLPMSAFVYAYDHNAPTVDHLAATHEPMYRRIRAAHPHIPVIFITRPGIRYTPDEVARRAVVRATYENALSRGEKVYFVDGETVFAIFGGDGGSVDGCHPNDLGFACVAAALAPIFEEIYG